MRKRKTAEYILVWDLPVRLCHLGFIVLLPAAWYSVEIKEDMDLHMQIGYALLALVLFRFIWGFIGGRTARFSDFIARPRAAMRYAASLKHASAQYTHAGHSPLGGWSVLALLFFISGQVVTGLFSGDEYIYGPLSEYLSAEKVSQVSNWHEWNFNVLAAFVALHIAAVIWYRWVARQDLLRPMISGYKRANNSAELRPIRGHMAWQGLLLAVLCYGTVWYLVRA